MKNTVSDEQREWLEAFASAILSAGLGVFLLQERTKE